MWITNGGFADVIVVFAKVDGEQFSAFIVERAFPGVSSGKEEHKMGLHGSSTTPIVLQDVPVPAGNLLGEIGKGHKVAFNVLNFGRFKLGAMCLGGARRAIGRRGEGRGEPAPVRRAHRDLRGHPPQARRDDGPNSRARGRDVRTAGLIDAFVGEDGVDRSASLLAALEEFAVEASIAKVLGSEVLEYVLDENVQIHGGNGYVRDYDAERHYRDARVNRIFEGTNEINRLLIPGLLIRRALKGDLPLLAAAKALRDEVMGPPAFGDVDNDAPLASEQRAVAAFRKTVLLVADGHGPLRADAPARTGGPALAGGPVIDTLAADSAVERAAAAVRTGHATAAAQTDAAGVYVQGAALRMEAAARQALAAMASGDVLRTQLAALRRVLKVMPADTVSPRRRLADGTVRTAAYLFG